MFQTTTLATNFVPLPGFQSHMKSQGHSLREAMLVEGSQGVRIVMKWDGTKKRPSSVSFSLWAQKAPSARGFVSQVATNPIKVNLRGVKSAEESIGADGFGMLTFHAENYQFSVSATREYIPDKKGFNSNSRKQSKGEIVSQFTELAEKIIPELDSYVKAWKWSGKAGVTYYIRDIKR